jgi:hypothetical protein
VFQNPNYGEREFQESYIDILKSGWVTKWMDRWMDGCPKKWNKAKVKFIRVVVMNVVFTEKFLVWMSSSLYLISWDIHHPSIHPSI